MTLRSVSSASIAGQPDRERPRVLIVGGSTRAAAVSAIRAGMAPVCADLFADLDTRFRSEIVPVRQYPNTLITDLADVTANGWFYTGALENQPTLLERMTTLSPRWGPLWGIPADVVRIVRDPFVLTDLLRSASLCAPDVLPQSSPPAPDGSWLQKPLASAGGRAIRVWDDEAASHTMREPHYFQKILLVSETTPLQQQGRYARQSRWGEQSARRTRSLSVVFDSSCGPPRWLGATEQLIGWPEVSAPEPFSYCGSVGPLGTTRGMVRLTNQARHEMARAAQVIVEATGLRGLFGIDFVLVDCKPYFIELNPRYTASIEVLELAKQRSLLPGGLTPNADRDSPQLGHGGSCAGRSTPQSRLEQTAAFRRKNRCCGKLILYADTTMTVPDMSNFLHRGSVWDIPFLADIPVPGTRIEQGWPIATVLAGGRTRQQCLTTCLRKIQVIKRRLFSAGIQSTSRWPT